MKKPKHIQGTKGVKLREKLRSIPYDQVLVVSIDPGKFFHQRF